MWHNMFSAVSVISAVSVVSKSDTTCFGGSAVSAISVVSADQKVTQHVFCRMCVCGTKSEAMSNTISP